MVYGAVGIRCAEHAGVSRAARPTARSVRRTPGQGVGARVRAIETPATWLLLGANVIIYLITASQAADRGGGANDPILSPLWLEWVLTALFMGGDNGWHRLVTSFFLHVSIFHLICNMAGLWWLGSIVERSLGTLRFVAVYLVSGLAGSAGALLFDPFEFTAGASGAILGVMGALVTMEWLRTRTIYTYGVAYIVLLLVLSFTADFLSFGGHLGGVVGGTLVAFVLVQTRDRRRLPGVAAVALIGLTSLAISYVRIETYTFTPPGAQPPTATAVTPDSASAA
jgi:membrane associated rhomboid family serine protease